VKNAFANFRANSRFLVIRAPGAEPRFYVFDGREFQPAQASRQES
jgi:hypothetical protein